MNIGSFHEAMNMAGLWGKQGMCPILFIIENNGYAMGTSVDRHSALTDLAARVRAYNIPSEKVDGAGHLRRARRRRSRRRARCARPASRTASRRSRIASPATAPPTSCSRIARRTKSSSTKHRDPIVILRNRLGEICGLTDDDVKRFEDEAAERVAAAVKFAEESPPPEAGGAVRTTSWPSTDRGRWARVNA